MADKKQIIFEFLNDHRLMILATTNDSLQPEAAVVGYSATDELHLIFDTFASYRKYPNLQSNPKVACVIGWENRITVQYEGIATEVSDGERDKLQTFHLVKHPKHDKFFTQPESRLFKITPTWIRYKDYNTNPWTEHLLTF